MRAFIAIEIPRTIKTELIQVIDRLKSSRADVKWVKPEGIHLTLKFLGNIDQQKIKEVKEILDKVAKMQVCFEIRLEGLGAFPKPVSPRVIWAGVKQGAQNTINLAKNLENQLEKIGFEKEKRPFHPHLTLGRLRSGQNKGKLVQLLKSSKFKSPSVIQATHVSLIQSTLTPGGAIYTPIYQTDLSR
jgi:2'-5' RNA ligase